MALFVKVLVISLFSAFLGKKQGRLPRYPLYQSNRPYMAKVAYSDTNAPPWDKGVHLPWGCAANHPLHLLGLI